MFPPFFPQLFSWLNIQGPSARDFDMGSWFSRHYHFSGNHRIEKEVVEDVASYGKQLGVLSDVVLALAKGEENEQVGRLEEMVNQIKEIKEKYSVVISKKKSRIDWIN